MGENSVHIHEEKEHVCIIFLKKISYNINKLLNKTRGGKEKKIKKNNVNRLIYS